MFKFLMGVAFGAAGYWAWQSFGRDLLGMSGDQETTYGGFSGGTSGSRFRAPSSSSAHDSTRTLTSDSAEAAGSQPAQFAASDTAQKSTNRSSEDIGIGRS